MFAIIFFLSMKASSQCSLIQRDLRFHLIWAKIKKMPLLWGDANLQIEKNCGLF